MDLSNEKWVVANGFQVWRDGHNAASSSRICTVWNAAKPVDQLAVEDQAKVAALIAAAPDLLRALKDLIHSLPATLDAIVLPAMDEALAAITKAEGSI